MDQITPALGAAAGQNPRSPMNKASVCVNRRLGLCRSARGRSLTVAWRRIGKAITVALKVA